MRILFWTEPPVSGWRVLWHTVWALLLSLLDWGNVGGPENERGSGSMLAMALTVNIGALLDSEQHRHFFIRTVQGANARFRNKNSTSLILNGTAVIMQTNPIRTAMEVCDRLVSGVSPLHALLILHPDNYDHSSSSASIDFDSDSASRGNTQPESAYQLASAAASYTVGFYRIPIIGVNSRESAFSDKSIHRSFLRTVPPYFHQADVWVRLLLEFGWKNIIVMTSANQNGRMLLGRLQSQVESEDIAIEKSIEYEIGGQNISRELEDVVELRSRVFLLYAEEGEAEVVFQQAALFGLTGVGHVWIVSQQALMAKSCPVGVLAVRVLHENKPEDYIFDTVQVLAQALEAAYGSKSLSLPPQSCRQAEPPWSDGPLFYQILLNQLVEQGRTGSMAFDGSGDRKKAEYEIISVYPDRTHVVVGACSVHGTTASKITLVFNKKPIIWPGKVREAPKGFIVPSQLKVYTLHEAPFTYVEEESNPIGCSEIHNGITCYESADNTSTTGNASSGVADGRLVSRCCWGYSIDLLRNLSVSLNFTYDLLLSSHTHHVNPEKKNRTDQPSGILNELIDGDGHLAVAALTITPEHAKYVEFSKPFKYLGITILEKKQPKASTLNSFFQPFTNHLWVLVMVSLHVVAVSLYLLDRFSPFSRYRLSEHEEPEDDALNLSSAMWFAWGVLLNSGIGEGTPRSFGGRVLGMVWAGFAMIMVASYTANLAAFLVLDRPQSSLSGVNDARLRNPTENFNFSTVRGSAVDLYFRRQVELATMYRIMEKHNYDDPEQAVAAVKNGTLQAFIWDSARLEYEAAKDKECSLMTAGELFGRSGYGVALRKNSPWTSKITLAILGLHENGFMESLDNKYIYMRNKTECVADENAPATLGLKNMRGVFILVGMGIAGGVILIIIEIMYKRVQVRKQRTARLSRMAFDRWRRYVERRKKSRQRNMLFRANTSVGQFSLNDPISDTREHGSKKRMMRGATISSGLI